ncbi:MAG: K+-dependent Na+/Ca+ exchanger [Cyclobacteriaceae bacterium]|nr:MAG: K+-dependent Na+/Ca+ exchanger [Cyclobacteriaceae bacterium]
MLIQGARILVKGAISLAKKLKISDLVVGLTIVSLGTSFPELVINLTASINGNSQIAIGNILGSNVANLLLILGVSALVYPLKVQKSTILSEIPFSIVAILLVGYLANIDFLDTSHHLYLGRLDGCIMLLFFFLFMAYIYSLSSDQPNTTSEDHAEITSTRKAFLWIFLGCAALFLGGRWVVNGAVSVATTLGLSESFIGLTIVAIGTSLPELVTSVTAALKKSTDLAVGNVVGSNIFNLLLILGLSAIIKPLPFTVASNTDIMTIVFSSVLLLFALTLNKGSIKRWFGWVSLVVYLAYILFLVSRG